MTCLITRYLCQTEWAAQAGTFINKTIAWALGKNPYQYPHRIALHAEKIHRSSADDHTTRLEDASHQIILKEHSFAIWEIHLSAVLNRFTREDQ